MTEMEFRVRPRKKPFFATVYDFLIDGPAKGYTEPATPEEAFIQFRAAMSAVMRREGEVLARWLEAVTVENRYLITELAEARRVYAALEKRAGEFEAERQDARKLHALLLPLLLKKPRNDA